MGIPDKPGWYLFKPTVGETEVVRVIKSFDTLIVEQVNSIHARPINEMHGEWRGSIDPGQTIIEDIKGGVNIVFDGPPGNESDRIVEVKP